MMLLMVWWCLRLSWIVSPRSLAELFCSIVVDAEMDWLGVARVEDGEVGLSWVGNEVVVVEVVDEAVEF